MSRAYEVRESPILETTFGRIRGQTLVFERHAAAQFLGIPYARPPIGELRFAVCFLLKKKQ